MTCDFRKVDGVTVIACGKRAAAQNCATCGKLGQLLCDGCDHPVCAPCAVSHRPDCDFCPACCRPIFKQWCSTEEGQRCATGPRDLRRAAFRAWVRDFAALRLEALRTKASLEVESANNGTLNPKPRSRK